MLRWWEDIFNVQCQKVKLLSQFYQKGQIWDMPQYCFRQEWFSQYVLSDHEHHSCSVFFHDGGHMNKWYWRFSSTISAENSNAELKIPWTNAFSSSQVRSAARKRWHRWQDHHALRVRVARAMSIPTSPTRISFHSIKQTTAVWPLHNCFSSLVIQPHRWTASGMRDQMIVCLSDGHGCIIQ